MTGSVSSRSGYQALREALPRKQFEVIVAESLNRLMRDKEESANFGKHCRYARIPVYTCAEGHATKLIMGIKGTINDVFLDDLADKTRRGLRGRIEAGASAGGLTYGYDVVPAAEGENRGGRAIDEAEADVVRRILNDYADGASPRAIAAALNREGVPGPSGGLGHRARSTATVPVAQACSTTSSTSACWSGTASVTGSTLTGRNVVLSSIRRANG